VTIDQVVHHHRFVAGGDELADAVAADVSGSAGDENFHGERVIDFRAVMARQIWFHSPITH
jgi:hypothetical protein